MTLEERLDSLYPVKELTDEELAIMRDCGMKEKDIAYIKSRAIFNSAINEKLREAYLLGRVEKDLYK